jgi:hypothetical protein
MLTRIGSSTGSTSDQTPLDLNLAGDAGTSMNFTNMGTEGLQFDPAWMDTAASNMDWVSCLVVVIMKAVHLAN